MALFNVEESLPESNGSLSTDRLVCLVLFRRKNGPVTLLFSCATEVSFHAEVQPVSLILAKYCVTYVIDLDVPFLSKRGFITVVLTSLSRSTQVSVFLLVTCSVSRERRGPWDL